MPLITRILEKSQTISAPEWTDRRIDRKCRYKCAIDSGGMRELWINGAAAPNRARWLAQVSEALEEAHRFMVAMNVGAELRPAAVELYLQIEAARSEVESLRLGPMPRRLDTFAPDWTDPVPWQFGNGTAQTPWGVSPPPENGSR